MCKELSVNVVSFAIAFENSIETLDKHFRGVFAFLAWLQEADIGSLQDLYPQNKIVIKSGNILMEIQHRVPNR